MMGQTRQVIDTDNFLPRFHERIYVYTSEYIIHVYRSLKNNYTKSTSLVASIYFFKLTGSLIILFNFLKVVLPDILV